MPPPLAPWFVLGFLAGDAGEPILVEPGLDASFEQLGEKNPLLGCVYWVGDDPEATWLAPEGPGGGGWHPLPAPEKVRDLPRSYRGQCYGKDGWGPSRHGAIGLTLGRW